MFSRGQMRCVTSLVRVIVGSADKMADQVAVSVSNKKPKKMLGKYCVAGGPGNQSCKNNSTTAGISMHVFPKSDHPLRATWIKFIQKHRKGWQPSASSYVCSAHFESKFFSQRPDIDINSDIRTKKRMLDREIAYPSTDVAGGVETGNEKELLSPRDRRQVMWAHFLSVQSSSLFAVFHVRLIKLTI